MSKRYKIKRKGDSYIRDALIIFGITLIAGLLMAMVYQITLKPIEKAAEETKLAAYQAIFKEGRHFESNEELENKLELFKVALEEKGDQSNVVKDLLEVSDDKGGRLGYVVTVMSKEGYGGAISLSFGVSNERIITGMEILSMNETASLGARCTEDEFLGQFRGIPARELTVTKDGKKADNQIDAISGATITSNAVVGAVNTGIALIEFMEGGNGGSKVE